MQYFNAIWNISVIITTNNATIYTQCIHDESKYINVEYWHCQQYMGLLSDMTKSWNELLGLD